MPYIGEDARDFLDPVIDKLAASLSPPGCGYGAELNYVLMRLAIRAKETAGSYGTIQEFMGALDCAAREIYRRIGAPHEDKAIAKNGDIPGLPPLEGKPCS